METRLLNPDRPEAVLRLGDGVARRLVIDLDAMRVAEAEAGQPFWTQLAVTTLERARLWLFACLARDATGRGEPWSLEELKHRCEDALALRLMPLVFCCLAAALPQPKEKEQAPAETPEDKPAGESNAWDWDKALWLGLRLGLKPAQFWALSLREFMALQDASGSARDEDRRFAAAMTANQMNIHLERGHRVSAETLLGLPEKVSRDQVAARRDLEAKLRKQQQEKQRGGEQAAAATAAV